MVSFPPKLLLSLLVYFFVVTVVFGQTTGLPSLTRGTVNTDSAQVVSEMSARTLIVPRKTVNLTAPSSLETMYSQFHGTMDQFGYEAFAGPVPATLPRGRTPEPYLLGPGDQLTILLWGDPVDLGELAPQFATKIDGDGTFFYPPVGLVRADGLLRADAEKTLSAGLAKKYKRFELKLQVNPQRVFPLLVGGLVAQPGSVMVDPWSSIPEVLAQAGGVEKNGSLRSIKVVKADGREVMIDLYDLLIHARKPQVKLEEGDVLWVGPIGKTAALIGHVKVPGIFELKPTETFSDLLAFAGGLLVSAEGTPVARVTKVGDDWVRSTSFWAYQDYGSWVPEDGDVYAFDSPPTIKDSAERPGFIKVGGEVSNPGFIEWNSELTLGQALEQAGGILESGNSGALILTRAELVAAQRSQIQTALQTNSALVASLQAKLEVATDPIIQGSLGQELSARIEAGNLLSQNLQGDHLGRIQLDAAGRDTVALRPGDSIFIPKNSGVVLILGEVYNPGAQLWRKGLTVGNALDVVGGISTNGSADEVYVIKATGRVESVRAKGNFLGLSSVWGMVLQSGDVIYAPTKRADTSQFWATTKDLISVLAETTGTVANVFVVLKTLGVL